MRRFDDHVQYNMLYFNYLSRFLPDTIYIPATVDIGGKVFTPDQAALNNGTRGGVSFNGSWTVSSLEITLTRSAWWVFVDEVSFDGVSAVPEPSTIIAGALLLVPFGVSAIRNSRKTRVA